MFKVKEKMSEECEALLKMAEKEEKEKDRYACNLCRRIFRSPQALGGHQNCHKWEKNHKQEMQLINNNIAKGKKSFRKQRFRQTLPIYNQHLSDALKMLQHEEFVPRANFATRTLQGALEIGKNSANPYPQMPNIGFGPSSGMHIGNSAFQHPQPIRFNPGLVTHEIGNPNPNFRTSHQHPLSATGFNAGSGTKYNGMLHGALQFPELARFNPGFETQQGGNFFVLPKRNDQVTGIQQVTKAEIDFGLVPKRGGEDKTQKGEASKIDLTLKL